MTTELLLALVAGSAGLVLGVYVVINGYYLAVHTAALAQLRTGRRRRRADPAYGSFEAPFLPGIAVVVPAYDEAETIVDSVRSLLDLNYPEATVVVVNDGSTDDTLERLRAAYDLEAAPEEVPASAPCEPVRGVYRSGAVDDLLVVDKDNGGKSDALNAGVWLTEQPLFCAVDADSLIDRDGLRRAVVPFLAEPSDTVAAGGTVRLVDGSDVEGGQVVDPGLSRNPLVALQEVEYLRAFYSGRLGLVRFGSLLVISGTFGLFRTDVVREVGGYSTDTVTEDLDLVVRLHRHGYEQDRPHRVAFVPEPVVWTQAPATLADLSRQRRRWYRGLLEVMLTHRDMLGNPRYGRIGVLAMPLYLLAEGLGPLVEAYGYVVVPVALALGALNLEFFAAFMLVIVGIGTLLSWYGVASEVWSYRRYDRPRQVLALLAAGVVENAGYRQWKAVTAVRGLLDLFRSNVGWGSVARRAFDQPDGDHLPGDGERPGE